jgi:predicted nucleic acid-binding protein
VYRVDSELAAELTTLSPHIAELQHAAEQATPGQRYLLERKLDAERKLELQRIAQQIASDVQAALARHAVAAARSPIPRGTAADAPGTMILNAAFLVAPDRFPEYQRALSEIVAAHNAHGFRFDFTGPWPAYHFVGENT